MSEVRRLRTYWRCCTVGENLEDLLVGNIVNVQQSQLEKQGETNKHSGSLPVPDRAAPSGTQNQH